MLSLGTPTLASVIASARILSVGTCTVPGGSYRGANLWGLSSAALIDSAYASRSFFGATTMPPLKRRMSGLRWPSPVRSAGRDLPLGSGSGLVAIKSSRSSAGEEDEEGSITEHT